MKKNSIPTALLSLFAALPLHAQFEFIEKEKSLELHENGKLVTALRSDYRVPYLFPLMSASGANIARYWPMDDSHPTEQRDHPHHRGLWLAHGDVSGIDFWHADENTAITVKSHKTSVHGDVATLTANLLWTNSGNEILSEIRTFTFSKPDPLTLKIEFTAALSTSQDEVVFGDTKEGTFAIRMDRSLRVKGPEAKSQLTDSEGRSGGAVWGKRALWTATHGPDELGQPVVVAIIDHADSFRHPTHWHARDYGLQAANPFGIHDFEKNPNKTIGNHTLAKGESLTLKYTVIIHQGSLDTAKLPQ